jgi:hypothetical protein
MIGPPRFRPFAHIPEELTALVTAELSSHTCDCVALARFAGNPFSLLTGGRAPSNRPRCSRRRGRGQYMYATVIGRRHSSLRTGHGSSRFFSAKGASRAGIVACRNPSGRYSTPAPGRRGWLKLKPWLAPRLVSRGDHDSSRDACRQLGATRRRTAHPSRHR